MRRNALLAQRFLSGYIGFSYDSDSLHLGYRLGRHRLHAVSPALYEQTSHVITRSLSVKVAE
jgi:hypothetical protein